MQTQLYPHQLNLKIQITLLIHLFQWELKKVTNRFFLEVRKLLVTEIFRIKRIKNKVNKM